METPHEEQASTMTARRNGARAVRVTGIAGNERINALSDGVFAIVMTLLVLELRVPEVPAPELLRAMPELVPEVLAYSVSFVVLGIYWVGQHNMLMHIKRHDRTFLWLNILFLLIVASMPFPTALVLHYSEEQVAVVIYAATLVLGGLSLDLMWWYATHNRRLVSEQIDPALIGFVHRRVLMAPVLYLGAIALSFLSVDAAKLLFALVALLYILPSPLDRRHHWALNAGKQPEDIEITG
ncbi:MAG: TMEM175 family protein [Chloroflexota bacterium]|nr:TMEM175 family protein [Chloroflexota bacterium]